MNEPTPEKRIGDSERRDVDTRLQQAHADGVLTLIEYDERSAQCWAARTRSELDALTRDLPDPAPPHGAAPVPAGSSSAATPGRRRGRLVTVVVAGVALFGLTQVVVADDGSAVFGRRVVQLAPDQTNLDVGVLFGNIEVVVPDDARVSTGGTMVFGSTRCDAACDGSGSRPVTIDGSGGFGSVEVVRQGERAERDAERARDDGDRDRNDGDRNDGDRNDGDRDEDD